MQFYILSPRTSIAFYLFLIDKKIKAGCFRNRPQSVEKVFFDRLSEVKGAPKPSQPKA